MQAYFEIFIIGLLGSMHCIGMCGGFVAMYSLNKPVPTPSLAYHVFYNAGRITTYAALGGVLGYIGSYAESLGRNRGLPGAVLLLSGLVMVIMGLSMAGLLGKSVFENTGPTDNSFFRALLRRVLAAESAWGTFLFGALLGFLPCGLLYPIFLTAAASGGFSSGVLTMTAFGLGTVPALMCFGVLMTRIRPALRAALFRIAAVLIVLLGLRTFVRGLSFNGWL
jgi:sulfite exporter TauE/SafE